MSDRDDEFLGKLESLGLEEVRRRRAHRDYGEKNLATVNYWIDFEERKLSEEASERNLLLRAEEIDIAREAKKAATDAATAAIIAAIAASVGMMISIISLGTAVRLTERCWL